MVIFLIFLCPDSGGKVKKGGVVGIPPLVILGPQFQSAFSSAIAEFPHIKVNSCSCITVIVQAVAPAAGLNVFVVCRGVKERRRDGIAGFFSEVYTNHRRYGVTLEFGTLFRTYIVRIEFALFIVLPIVHED